MRITSCSAISSFRQCGASPVSCSVLSILVTLLGEIRRLLRHERDAQTKPIEGVASCERADPDGELGELDLNGAQMDLVRVEQDGRPVGATYIELKPGQTVDLSWTMESGAGQTGGAEVSVTPTIEKKDGAKALTSACAPKGN